MTTGLGIYDPPSVILMYWKILLGVLEIILVLAVGASMPVLPGGETDYGNFRALPPQGLVERIQINSPLAAPVKEDASFYVVVDVSENVEYVYKNGQLIMKSPVSTGSASRYEIPYYTPLGRWKIISRESSSGEYGPYFLRLARWQEGGYVRTDIGLHGTNEPQFLGRPASHGCIRHDNRVITQLYKLLPVGTVVETVE